MKIKLKGELGYELTMLGLKAGDVVNAYSYGNKHGALTFTISHRRYSYDCIVWPENFDILPDDSAPRLPSPAHT